MVKTPYGQHFLQDDNIINHELRYATLSRNDVVLEIGPGHGALTKKLAQLVDKVIAIELDTHLFEELSRILPSNVTLINQDAVKVDLSRLSFTKIVANLPFHISSPITFKLLEQPFIKAILIYQKDFAARMIAQPGTRDYSRLSVGIFYKTVCRILENVPRTCFFPKPRVDACIVELLPRQKPPFPVLDETFFFRLTKELFSHRRKKIMTTLRAHYPFLDTVPFADHRVEQLSPAEIGHLSDIVFEQIQQQH